MDTPLIWQNMLSLCCVCTGASKHNPNIQGNIQTYGDILTYGVSRHRGTQTYRGIQTYGGVQTYRRHPNLLAGIQGGGQKQDGTNWDIVQELQQQRSYIGQYIGQDMTAGWKVLPAVLHTTWGASKHMGMSKHTGDINYMGMSKHTWSKHMGASKHTGVSKHRGHPNIQVHPNIQGGI